MTHAEAGDIEALALKSIGRESYPPIGDDRKRYPVTLTEPEINAIHAAYGFMKAACKAARFQRFWDNYGPTLEALSERLIEFDDEDAPYTES
jgi:hypothetical protein